MPEIETGSTELVQTDSGAIYDAVIRSLEQGVSEPLYPGDERRIFGEALAAELSQMYGVIQDAARQVMLRYARGEVLDALGARLGVARLEGEPARCVLRFSLAQPLPQVVTIPAGTKATADGELYFATIAEAVIDAGESSVDVAAVCTERGAVGNGYGVDSVTTLVDLIPYVASVRNVTTTEAGDDGEPYTVAGDDRLRERILLAPSTLSTAGPEKGYVYWAKTADAGISDVAAISQTEYFTRDHPVVGGHVYIGGDLLVPETVTVNGKASGFSWTYDRSLLDIALEGELAEAETATVKIEHKMDGRVRIIVLMEGGEPPDQDTIDAVYAACSAADVRPLTDVVTVEGPRLVPYDIELEYWTTPEDEAACVRSIEGAGGAIERYVSEQGAVLGRDINPDVLEGYIMRPDWAGTIKGAIRVDIIKPEYTELAGDEAATFTGNVKTRRHIDTYARWS